MVLSQEKYWLNLMIANRYLNLEFIKDQKTKFAFLIFFGYNTLCGEILYEN